MSTVTVAERPRLKARMLARIPVAFAIPIALLFGGAGTWNWPAAWVYLALIVSGGTAAMVVFARYQPELVKERTERWRDGKSWDKPFVFIVGIIGPVAVQLVCGLDHRFAWSPPASVATQMVGTALFIVGTSIVATAMAVNRFFSAVVRIQTDRGHTVIDSGPYRYVRHPGYTGMLLGTIGGPLLLGSRWGLVPALLLVVILVVRTELEDRTLQNELPGYLGYARRVRSKLLPGVW